LRDVGRYAFEGKRSALLLQGEGGRQSWGGGGGGECGGGGGGFGGGGKRKTQPERLSARGVGRKKKAVFPEHKTQQKKKKERNGPSSKTKNKEVSRQGKERGTSLPLDRAGRGHLRGAGGGEKKKERDLGHRP